MARDYKVSTVDNRGTDEKPFGFVNLVTHNTDAGRIGFGPTRENPEPLGLWHCNSTPHDISTKTLTRVRAKLAQCYPHLDKAPVT